MAENTQNSFKKAAIDIKLFVKDTFDIFQDTDHEATIEDIKSGVNMRGQNAWILIFSILVASAGLNTSSTAVVIGAMLISPLMGPILGMGLSLGINDIDFLKKAIKNFGVMVVLSLLTSFLFFSIPMFQQETPELLARTFPDVRDVIIALSGGLALIIALSRRNKSINTIAGVAIATALMPPLCTAGYGLATAKWDFFGGALFLFSINTIFIATATFIVVRFLKFPYEAYANSQRRKRISQIISFLALAILIPSVYMFYQLYVKSDFNQKADILIDKLRTEKGILILDVHKNYNKKTINFAVVGTSISQTDIKKFQSQMKSFGYDGIKFKVLQDAGNLEAISKINEIENSFLSNQQLLVKKDQLLLDKDKEIFNLKNQLHQKGQTLFPFNQIAEEIKALNSDVEKVAYSKIITTNFSKTDTIPTFEIIWKSNIPSKTQTTENLKLQNWLRKKLKDESILVVK
ncbi:TIGR00341 family protein [Flavobacterium ardleyense]|uniref:TIGR00341 family protein n=1 Tax=Flavobacterium ardleyense TaxID=2038737 RepID=A0ABW5Z4V5_9FLAO